MIYTVTLNPAIDYVLHTGEIVPGATNRSKAEEYYYGGKGINVSAVLKELGLSSCALGFVAGFTGDAIENGVKAMGIETDFVKLNVGNSRINVKIKASHRESENKENVGTGAKTEVETDARPVMGMATEFDLKETLESERKGTVKTEKENEPLTIARRGVAVKNGTETATDSKAFEEKSFLKETEINGKGPDIDSAALEDFYKKLEKLKPGDILVLSGSIPGSLPEDTYEKIMERVSVFGEKKSFERTETAIRHDTEDFEMSKKAGTESDAFGFGLTSNVKALEAVIGRSKTGKIKVVVDAEGRLLLSVLKHRPFLVKPNKDELGALFGVKIESMEDAFMYAGKLREMGAENVLVSLGADGAILLDENDERHYCKAPKGRLLNSVGAGDSMVAGFLAGLISESEKSKECEMQAGENALRLGVAAGSATAFSEGLAKAEKINEILKNLDT